MKQEEVWTEEKDALVLLLEQLKTVSQDQINPENNSVLEEPNTKLTKELSEALEKLTFVQEENTQLSETLTKQTSEVASLNMSNTRLTEELSTRENKLTSLQESVSELTQVLREEQKRNAELNEDLERVKNVRPCMITTKKKNKGSPLCDIGKMPYLLGHRANTYARVH